MPREQNKERKLYFLFPRQEWSTLCELLYILKEEASPYSANMNFMIFLF